MQSVHNLNKALVAQGAEVTVYTTSANGPKNLDVPLNTPVDIDGVKVWYFKPGIFRFWFYSRALHKALRANVRNFDIVHITSTFLFASTLGTYYAKKSGVPRVISPRGNLMKVPLSMSPLKKKLYLALIERRNLARADAIHFTSEEEKRDYIELGFPARTFVVVPNGVEAPKGEVSAEERETFRKKHDIERDAFVFSYLGRVSRIKGFDVLIPAFAEAAKQHQGAVLLVIGGDDEKGYLRSVKEQIAQFGVEGKVIFAGMLSGHAKDVALAASQALVQPSSSESFGMSSAEAVVHSIPVIVNTNVGTATVIQEHSFGEVYRFGETIEENIAALSRVMVRMMEDDGLLKKFHENEKKEANIFSQEKVARQFISAYDSLIKQYEKRS